MTEFFAFVRSPVGPCLILWIGALTLTLTGRWLRRSGWLTGLALFFLALAALIWSDLRFQPIVPEFSRAWQPIFQTGANLVWVGDGWNWYVAGLALLLGGVGILVDDNGAQLPSRRMGVSLALQLVVVGAATLFVSSANILTVVFTWVFLDLAILLQGITGYVSLHNMGKGPGNSSRGLSLVGALLLLMALLPAGPSGPNQPLQGGSIPFETIFLLTGAAILRSGVYPFHFWISAGVDAAHSLARRLIEQVIPVLSGLWLLGWCISLGGQAILASAELLAFLTLAMLAAAFIAFTAQDQQGHTTFVLIAAAALAALAGSLFYRGDTTAAMLWPITTFALGGSLWLVGERVWQGWGWQIPMSVGALALAGAPFTPGFLMQPSLARLLLAGPGYFPLFAIYVLAQSLLIAALLRSWSAQRREAQALHPLLVMRLWMAAVIIAIPLALAGFLPFILSAIASIPGAIPPLLGNPPIVVAEPPVWITLVFPLTLGLGLVWLTPRIPDRAVNWLTRAGQALQLNWLFQGAWWGFGRLSASWGSGFGVIEGAGYLGWAAALMLLAYLLIR